MEYDPDIIKGVAALDLDTLDRLIEVLIEDNRRTVEQQMSIIKSLQEIREAKIAFLAGSKENQSISARMRARAVDVQHT